jgi:YD repeat-containing protein
MEFVNTPGPGRTLAPQAVVLLDPGTGLPYVAGGGAASGLTDAQLRATSLMVSLAKDNTGATINPEGWSHVYAYNGSGSLLTDTASDGVNSWVKTFSYTSGNLTGETKWVRQ